MIRRPPRSTRTDTLFPTRRSSDLARAEHRGALAVGVAHALVHDAIRTLLTQVPAKRLAGGIAVRGVEGRAFIAQRSEEHTSELQSLMRISYAVFCLKKKTQMYTTINETYTFTCVPYRHKQQ